MKASNGWIEIQLEKTRVIAFKSQSDKLELTNVTHAKKRNHGYMLKCDQGLVYFETNDVSWIISDCEDWVI